MRASDKGSRTGLANLRRIAPFLLGLAMLLAYTASARAAISTSGSVNPHPATTTGSDTLYIGETAFGTMNIDDGSDVTSGTSYLGYEAGATGLVGLSGTGSTWSTRRLIVGQRGTGQLTIQGGATVNSTSSASLADTEFSDGFVTVTGANSRWNLASGSLTVGNAGSGSLTIADGGQISSGFANVGGFDGIGSATITGNGSSWTSTSNLTVADGNHGTLTISDGGLMSNRGATIAQNTDSVGSVIVDGASSKWTSTGDLTVGSSGAGTLNITGALVEVTQDTFVGRSTGGNGSIHFDNGTLTTGGLLARLSDLTGTGTINTKGLVTDIDLFFDQNNGLARQFTLDFEPEQNILVNFEQSAAGSLGAGFRGEGSVTIAGGVTVASRNVYLGYHSAANGQGTVEGSNSKWTITGDLNVGFNGTGRLNIANGGSVDVARSTYLGRAGASVGSIHFDNGTLNTKSLWASPNELHGTGTVNTNGVVSDINLVFDANHPAQQQIMLASAPDQNVTINLNADGSGAIGAGYRGESSLTIADGVAVRSNAGYIGYHNGSNGTATISGEDSAWIIGGELSLALNGTGELTVSNGAALSSVTGNIGHGKLTVTGQGSLWTNSSLLAVGAFGLSGEPPAELRIFDGGRVVSFTQPTGVPLANGIGDGFGSNGLVSVSGAGSSWTHQWLLTVGGDGSGMLMISDGGRVTSNGGVIADGSGFFLTGTSSVTVTGIGSEWINSGVVTVGNGRAAALTISNGGRVTSTDGFIAAGFTSFSTAPATVTLSGDNSRWDISGRLAVGGGSFTSGGPALMTVGSGTTVDVGGETRIFRQGILKLDGGTLATSEIRFDFSGGQFQWTAGTLHVGRYNANLTNSAGMLAPGEPIGNTTITGSYTQQAAATLQIEIGGINPTSQHDVVTVQSNVALGGQLQLALINSFVPGPHNIFTVLSATGNVTGAFSNIANGQRLLTSDGAGSFLVHYGSTSAFNTRQIVLTNFESALLPGDFNRDGSVDAADYVVWRRSPSGNALVDTTNYQTWRSNFGRTAALSAGSASVPEPSALAIFGAFLFAGMLTRLRVRKCVSESGRQRSRPTGPTAPSTPAAPARCSPQPRARPQ
jgi:T5SS/PEP-CTERM-associated repeat protein